MFERCDSDGSGLYGAWWYRHWMNNYCAFNTVTGLRVGPSN